MAATDIAAGTQVLVKDSKGKIIATGALSSGAPAGALSRDFSDGTSTFPCAFPFTVSEVPAGSDFYQVEVGKRRAITYKQKDLSSPIKLTLGD